jgi:hypothetical protein
MKNNEQERFTNLCKEILRISVKSDLPTELSFFALFTCLASMYKLHNIPYNDFREHINSVVDSSKDIWTVFDEKLDGINEKR